MKGIHLTTICLFIAIVCNGQTENWDSMYASLPVARDSNRIIALKKITKIAQNSDLNRARKYIDEIVSITEDIGESEMIAESKNLLGINFYYVGEIDSAILMFEDAYEQYQAIGNKDRLAALLNNLGSMSSQKGDYQSAIEYHLRSLRLKEVAQDSAGIAASYYNLGISWVNLEQYEEAQQNFEKSKIINEAIGDRYSVGECIEALAVIEDDYERYDEGILLHQQALQIAKEFDDINQASIILSNLGDSYSTIEKCDSALIYLEEALTYATEVGNYNSLSYIERTMGECYGKLGNHKKSIQILNSVIERSKEEGLAEKLSDDYNYLYSEYKRAGNYREALFALEDHMNLRDSTRGVQTERMVRDLNTKYETEKKDAEIKLLNKQTELDATRKKALWGGMGLLGLLAGGIIYGQMQRRKRIEERAENEKEIEIQKRKSAEQELEYKKKELTAKALQLARKNEFLSGLESEIDTLKSSVDTSVSKTSSRISRMIRMDANDDQDWEQFGKEFSSVHQDFLDRLYAQYGKFSKNELRLIALMKMNISSKDIANTLRISDDGIKKARYRLRKKLDLASDIDIQDYLLSY